MKKRILSILLAACLLCGLLPTTALAADSDKAIMRGTSGISGYDSTDGYDYIYMGYWTAPDEYTANAPIKWRVLDDKTNTGESESGLFLLSETLFGTGQFGGVYFQETCWAENVNGWITYKGTKEEGGRELANAWQNSDAQAWCRDFAGESGSNVTDAFAPTELGAILATTKNDEAYTAESVPNSAGKVSDFSAAENILNGDKVFFLSAEEAENSDYGFVDDTARQLHYVDPTQRNVPWLLRSPVSGKSDVTGCVAITGGVDNYNTYRESAVRPAFNLNLNSVLFTSAAEGGKPDGFNAVADHSGSEWKLTLLDGTRSLSATTTAVNGNVLTLAYKGAATGANEYISALITDSSGAVTCYGRLKNLAEESDASGTLQIDVTGKINDGDTLYIFNEQYNEDKRTDYASALIEVSLTDNTPPALTAGTVSRTDSANAAVKFTSDEGGTQYYAIVESGSDAPTIDMSGEGAVCVSGENTLVLVLSDWYAKDVYIVVRDAAGNESIPLKLEIPLHPVYSISADPATLNFGSVQTGYDTPAAQTITITNTGNQQIMLTQPTAGNFVMSALSKTTLAAEETATFTVQPSAALPAGTYDETIAVIGTNDCGSTNELSITVGFEVEEVPTYAVNVSASPAEGGTASGGGTYDENESVTVIAAANDGYKFVKWTENGAEVSTSASYTFAVTANRALVAVFEADGGSGGDPAPHSHYGGTATCQSPATCSGCGQTYGSNDSSNHTGGTEIRNQSSSYTGDTYCLGCGVKLQPGTTIGGGSTGGGSSGGSSSNTTTTTERNPDGSTTTTTDKTTGTVTETTSNTDGSTTTVETKTDGTVTTTDKAADGSTMTTVEDADGNVTAEATVSSKAGTEIVEQAKESGSTEIVIAPEVTGDATRTEVSIPAATAGDIGSETAASLTVSTPVAAVTIPNGGLSDLASAGGTVTVTTEKTGNTVTLEVTAGDEAVREVTGGITLTVPHEDTTPGTVAVLVYEDGTREVIPKSVSGDGFVIIPLTGSATLELVDNSKRFEDVPDDAWQKDAVDFVSARGLLNGTSDTTFSADAPMTRGMMAVFLHNLESNPEHAFTGGFDDVADGAWYSDAVLWAAESGIVSGYGGGLFGPDDPITREQLAVMLWRYAGNPAPKGAALNFTDADEASDWALDALIWAQENGIMQGYNGAVDPRGNASRSHVAQMLKNFLENVLKK